jgi:hypothetical protein
MLTISIDGYRFWKRPDARCARRGPRLIFCLRTTNCSESAARPCDPTRNHTQRRRKVSSRGGNVTTGVQVVPVRGGEPRAGTQRVASQARRRPDLEEKNSCSKKQGTGPYETEVTCRAIGVEPDSRGSFYCVPTTNSSESGARHYDPTRNHTRRGRKFSPNGRRSHHRSVR